MQLVFIRLIVCCYTFSEHRKDHFDLNNLKTIDSQVFRLQHKSDISDVSVQINIDGFKKFQQKIKLPPVGCELTTLTITG